MKRRRKQSKANPPLANRDEGSQPSSSTLSTINCLQLNLHKSKNANFFAAKQISKYKGEEAFILFSQEPNMEGDVFHYMPKQTHRFHYKPQNKDTENWPRAAIVASQSLDLIKLPELCDRDNAVGLLRTKVTGIRHWQKENILLCSGYWPNEEKNIPIKWEEVMVKAKTKNYKVIFSVDANAHSLCFGSKDENERGRKINRFITKFNLIPVNLGGKPTWSNSRYETVIDLTFVSADLANSLFNWTVEDEYTHSDHKLITYSLQAEKPFYEIKQSVNNVDWNSYSNICDEKLPNTDLFPIQSLQKMVRTIDETQDVMIQTVGKLAPKKRVKVNARIDDIWNDEINEAHNACRHARKEQKKHPTEENRIKVMETESNFSELRKFYEDKQAKEFKNNINTSQKMARLNKAVNNDERHSLGLLRKPDGTYTENVKESINIMYDRCFPGSEDYLRSREDERRKEREMSEVIGTFTAPAVPWISVKRIKRVLKAYSPLKSPGLDNIKPILIENLPERGLKVLKDIYQAMHHLEYTPIAWRKSRCVFLPKTGKERYDLPGSFRPITLSSHMLKVYEKLVLIHINEEALANSPLSVRQHAFRRGRNVETITLDVIGAIERALYSDKLAAAVFLDISQAFDTVKPEAIVEAMTAKKISAKVVSWYGDLIKDRISECHYKGEIVSKTLNIGCPQGGIISPTCWNLVFDKLISKIEETSSLIFAFADDGTLLAFGDNINKIFNRLNIALAKVKEWATEVGLKVSKEKTVAMVFSFKKLKEEIKVPPIYDNAEIPIVDKTKYLGLIIDSKLSWTPHLKEKEAQARKLYHVYKRSIGGKWGPSPMMARWLWTNVLRPRITYGSIIWQQSIDTEGKINTLRKIQRQGLLNMGMFRNNMPGPVLEVIGGVPPLHLFLRETALKAAVRNREFLKQDWAGYKEKTTIRKGIVKTERKESLHFKLRAELKALGLRRDDTYDQEYKVRLPEADFSVEIGDGMPARESNTLTVYTDGSKLNSKTGAALFIQRPDGEEIRFGIKLNDYNSVFQCEIYAINLASDALLRLEPEQEEVTFYVDSQAALLSLISETTGSKMVKMAFESLQQLAAHMRVKLVWCKAHIGTYGNEIVDKLAKEATLGENVPYFNFPMPKAHTNQVIRQSTINLWQSEWCNSVKYSDAKVFFPNLRLKASEAIMKLPRDEFSRLARWVSGMNGLYSHESKIDPEITTDRCRLCSGLEDDYDEIESAEHLTFKCAKLIWTRASALGYYEIDPPYVWTVKGLRNFLKNRYIQALEFNSLSEGTQCWEELQFLRLRVVGGELTLLDVRKGVG